MCSPRARDICMNDLRPPFNSSRAPLVGYPNMPHHAQVPACVLFHFKLAACPNLAIAFQFNLCVKSCHSCGEQFGRCSFGAATTVVWHAMAATKHVLSFQLLDRLRIQNPIGLDCDHDTRSCGTCLHKQPNNKHLKNILFELGFRLFCCLVFCLQNHSSL